MEGWRRVVMSRYEQGLGHLQEKGVSLPYEKGAFVKWLSGVAKAEDLVRSHPAFAGLIPDSEEWPELPEKQGIPMPPEIRENYVTVCVAYKAAGAERGWAKPPLSDFRTQLWKMA